VLVLEGRRIDHAIAAGAPNNLPRADSLAPLVWYVQLDSPALVDAVTLTAQCLSAVLSCAYR
jgi:hypothetical protein